MQWLVAIPVLLGLGLFLVLIVVISVRMVADLLTGSRPKDFRRRGSGRDHKSDWP
jgi:hypothetical protein